MLKSNVTKEQLKRYLEEYFETYQIPSMFRFQYEQYYLEGLNGGTVDSQIAQFYKEYDLIEEEYDAYKAFTDIIKYGHPDLSDKTILEVGGGYIPQLGRELAKEAKNVIVVDKNLVTNNNPSNLEPIKKRVESYKELPKADIVVGLLPCEASQHIIDYAVCNKTDFVIALCGCFHNLELDDLMRSRMYKHGIKLNTVERYEKYAMVKMEEEAPELGNIMLYDSPYQFPEDVIGNKRGR